MKSEAVRNLSPRQRECLRLVAELKTTEQIADLLKISPSTVNTHIERAMTILGATSRRGAALLVLEDEASGPDKPPTEFQRLSEDPVAPAASAASATVTRRRRNVLTYLQRSGAAFLVLALTCIAIGSVGAAIEQLSDWRTSLGQTPHASAATRGAGDPS